MALTETAPPPSPELLFASVLATFGDHHPDGDTDLITRAYQRARSLHSGQKRRSGEPFITHPLIVTEILAAYGMDASTLAAALLHDTVEDTNVTLEDIADEFGDEVAGLIDGVTKLDRLRFSSREEAQAATIRKMAIAMAKDIRVLLIKLADRLHNVRTLAPLPEEKRRRIAEETIEVYAPLAHRLGVQEIKHEMEERCFGELYPKRKAELEELVARRAPEREVYLEKVMAQIVGALADQGISADVTGRPKHLYSIYRKMVSSGLAFDEIHDLIGIRVLVDDVKDCYATLGLVHTMWPPIHGRFKDYIAMPKFNLYQSLHTTVVGPDGKALEVQIRTHEMHRRAEFGIAAHWSYKEGAGSADDDFVADLRFLHEESTDPEEFLNNLKLDLYQEEVFALTPKGDVVTLPRGATPVDFAYRIHTDVGHRCVGAKVNGRLVPLHTELESGDIVEILTSKSQDAHPSRDWLDFVKSSRAAAKIRRWFTRERREAALSDGRELVTKALRREGEQAKAANREELLTAVAEDLGYADVTSMYVAVGDGRISAKNVVRRMTRLIEVDGEEDLLQPPSRPTRRTPQPSRGGIIVEGMDDLLVRIARCCAPVPGDPIVGFITVGRGVSVHRADCANVGALGDRKERMIDVSWAPEHAGSFFVWIQIEALDRPKLLRDVTIVLSEMGANITASSSATGSDRVAVFRFEVEVSEPQMIDVVINGLRKVDGVFDAYRLVPQTTDKKR
ncbi:MAG TPA: bifunctional (p)ppGpp synthetase/guanosine-3',5'-bis(diphosphate) 3'-pyrophosphohydrolase [Acidimicrobiia bacterium]|jgi:GTP pyrophosphokinase|nr:bifunctional (p)ppGpp synthetase/guanosine-3',5'-bis(diphosphate) 3'-pyrophosphohydrolase [Acidimicrobiia bacterium]